ncbi:unnamed protein product, partial [marine sediment metagenome]
HPSLTVDDPAYEETVKGLMADLRGLVAEETTVVGGTTVVSDKRIVSGTRTFYDTGLSREEALERDLFVASNETGGDVTFAMVDLEGELEDAIDNIDPVLDAVAEAEAASDGFEILIGGDASLNKQLVEIIEEDFSRALFLNLPIAFLILFLAFGAVVAASVPLALAFAAVITANGILAIVSQFYPLEMSYQEMVLLMGLATGIDYALFVVTRYRRECRAGRSKEEALRVASGTSGKAVVFAGMTVLLAISGMFMVDNAVFTSLALAAIVVVALAIVMSVTLLPALIAMLGDNIDRLSLPFLGRGTGEGGGVWGFITDRVLAQPAIIGAVTVVVLLAVAAPYLTLNLGFNGPRSFSDDAEGKKALIALEENFTIGLMQPAVVIVDAGEKENVFAADIQASVAELVGLVELESRTPESPDEPYGAVAMEPDFNDAGDTELIAIPINADSGDPEAIDAVNRLRDDLVPAAFED